MINKAYIFTTLQIIISVVVLIFQAPVMGYKNSELKFDQQQYDFLKRCSEHKDVSDWNRWRIDHPDKDIFLDDVILEKTNLEGVYLNSGKFIDKAGAEHDFTGHVYLRNTRFNHAHLNGANFEGADLEQARFGSANLVNSRLARASLLQASFYRANLQGANFENSKLKNANLEQAKLQKANLSNANLERCRLQRAILEETVLENANLRGSNLSSTDLNYVNLKKANLQYATFNRAIFKLAHLEGASFNGANLENAVFLGTYLQGTSFRASIVNGYTWINTWELDNQTDFRSVALGNIRMTSSTKQRLEYNKRRLNWEDWYKDNQWKQWPARIFWWISDYGISTLRVTLSFLIVASFFSIIYYIFGLIGIDVVEGLFEDQGQRSRKGLRLKVLLRSFYFSVVTMTTLGFGDIRASRNSITGQFIVIFQVICGYLLLGALITRLGILFTAGGPVG